MIQFLFGEDDFRVRERETELALAFQKKEATSERSVFDSDEEWTREKLGLLRETLSGGLFASPRLILLRQVGALSDENAKGVKELLTLSLEGSDALVIASHSGKIKKTHPLIIWLLKKTPSEEFSELLGPARLRYVEALLKKLDPQATIEGAAAHELIIRTGANTGKLFQELSKFVAYRDGKKITLADINLLSEESIESNIFLALDAIVQGRRGHALSLLRREEKNAVPIQKTLGLCAWQLRRLLEVEELFSKGMRDAGSIARELKSSSYPIQKILPQLSRFQSSRLRHGMTLLADLDVAIRNGKTLPGVALDLFVWKF